MAAIDVEEFDIPNEEPESEAATLNANKERQSIKLDGSPAMETQISAGSSRERQSSGKSDRDLIPSKPIRQIVAEKSLEVRLACETEASKEQTSANEETVTYEERQPVKLDGSPAKETPISPASSRERQSSGKPDQYSTPQSPTDEESSEVRLSCDAESEAKCEADPTDVGSSHRRLVALTAAALVELIAADPLLSDLPADVTLDEIQAQIALVRGESVSVTLAAPQPATLVVPRHGTVTALKRALARHTALRLARQGRVRLKVSWRRFWRSHWLGRPGGAWLDRDSDRLADLGIGHRTVLTFAKRRSQRQR